VIGRTIRIEGVPVTIVGVGPAGYNGTINIGLVTDFWLPIASLPVMGAPSRVLERRPEEAAFLVKARLKDGITVAQAQAAMRVLGARLASEYPNEDPGRGITVFASRDVRVHPQLDAAVRWTAVVVLAVVGLVLAIACSNLATLLLVRGASRAKELSMRLALGATRRQIVRHLLIESLLLSAAGGIAGSLVAWWAVSSLGAVDLPVVLDLRLDYRVFAFAAALALLTGLAFGLIPALKASRIDLVPALRDQGETRSGDRWFSLKNAFVVFQVMVSVVLLGGTSMFLQLLSTSRAHRGNFAVDGVAIVETDPRYSTRSRADAANVFEELVRRTAAIPGVEAAALSRDMPLSRTGTRLVVEGPAGAAGGTVRASMIWAGPRFFDVLQLPVLYGRAIDERDRPDTPRVAVLSESMAIRVFQTANPVGRRFHLELDPNTWFEVVGVVRDSGSSGPQTDFEDHSVQVFYRSFSQEQLSPNVVLARSTFDAGSLLGSMQRELRIVDATLPVTSARTMAQYLEESLATPKAVASFLGALGGVGLALATIGLYAIVAFAVSRRAREIGIRMALGARGPQVVWHVAREVAVLLAAGTGAGLVLCLLTILGMRSVVAPAPGISLYRPSADPLALAAIVAIMAIVGLAAASLPAWRAVKMDPLTALRRD
jgi:predicted permease